MSIMDKSNCGVSAVGVTDCIIQSPLFAFKKGLRRLNGTDAVGLYRYSSPRNKNNSSAKTTLYGHKDIKGKRRKALFTLILGDVSH